MIEKTCIAIDDESQTEILEQLASRLRKEQIDLKFEQLNPQDDAFQKNVGGGTPDFVVDLDEIVEALRTSTYLGRRVDIITCDFNLGDDEINGIKVIEAIRNQIRFKGPIIVYSGNLEHVITNMLKTDVPKEKQAKNIRALLNLNVSKYLDREDYSSSVIEILKPTRFSLEAELEAALDVYGGMTFSGDFSAFVGKTLADVAGEIRKGTAESVAFQRHLIEKSVESLVDVRKEFDV